MMGLKAAFFDLDGTLVDSAPGIQYSVDEALAACGFPPRQGDLRPLIGPPIRAILSKLAGEIGPDRMDVLERAFRASYDSSGWERTTLHSGARSLLETLRESGLRLFVVTNKPSRPAECILQRTGIRELFTSMLSRDSVDPPFPSKADMLLRLLRLYRIAPKQSMFIGDSLEDCQAGRDAGVPVYIVRHGYGGFDAQAGDTNVVFIDHLMEAAAMSPRGAQQA